MPLRAGQNATRTLDSLRSQLAAVNVTGDSSVVDQLAALEQSNVTLKEEAAADLQLAQLGMAIEIISRSVRSGLRSLKAWADVNHELMSLYQGIRGSFDPCASAHAPARRPSGPCAPAGDLRASFRRKPIGIPN